MIISFDKSKMPNVDIKKTWKKEDGFVQRSKDNDWRNKNGLNYTSLIVDAIKI